VLVADIKHRHRLIDADDAPALELLRQWPRHSSRTGRQVKNQLIAFERQRFDQFGRQVTSHIRQATLIELGGMRRIVETSFMFVAVRMTVIVLVSVSVVMVM
jgi:hypothetical protein